MSGNQDGINVQWILTEFCKYSRPIRLYGYWVYSLILCNIAWCFIECISRNFWYCRYMFKMNNSCIHKTDGNSIAIPRCICFLQCALRRFRTQVYYAWAAPKAVHRRELMRRDSRKILCKIPNQHHGIWRGKCRIIHMPRDSQTNHTMYLKKINQIACSKTICLIKEHAIYI